MEKVRKRHASLELQSLSTAVLMDYTFFTNFDSIFQSPKEKRARYDTTTKIIGAKPRQRQHMEIENEFLKNYTSSEAGFVLQKRNELIDSSFAVERNQIIPKLTRIVWGKQPLCDPETSPHEDEVSNKRNIERLQISKNALEKAMNDLEEEKNLKKMNGNKNMMKPKTQIIYNTTSQEKQPYEKAFLAFENEKVKNGEAWEILNKTRNQELRGLATRDRSCAMKVQPNQPITITIDDDVPDSPTNEKSVNKESIRVSPVQSDGSSGSISSPDHVTLSPNMEIPPDYVITKVGSLLWLGKEMVYPITLAEIRRRVEDPENFSFQMLIAYVRHSRAKGRQFLSFWNCMPSGKTCKPNVLSKLCEADVQQLFEGIKNVNEQYFPTEKVAEHAAKTMKTKGIYDGSAKSLKETFQRIQKSRSVLQQIDEVLTKTEESEKFDTFNIATHNIGLANIKYTLKFLENIFESVQNKMVHN